MSDFKLLVWYFILKFEKQFLNYEEFVIHIITLTIFSNYRYEFMYQAIAKTSKYNYAKF